MIKFYNKKLKSNQITIYSLLMNVHWNIFIYHYNSTKIIIGVIKPSSKATAIETSTEEYFIISPFDHDTFVFGFLYWAIARALTNISFTGISLDIITNYLLEYIDFHVLNTQQINTFKKLFPHISENGLYLCEDIHTSYRHGYNRGFLSKRKYHPINPFRLIKLLQERYYLMKNKLMINHSSKFFSGFAEKDVFNINNSEIITIIKVLKKNFIIFFITT